MSDFTICPTAFGWGGKNCTNNTLCSVGSKKSLDLSRPRWVLNMTHCWSFAHRTPSQPNCTKKEECGSVDDLVVRWPPPFGLFAWLTSVEYSSESKCSSYSHPGQARLTGPNQLPLLSLNAIALNSSQAFTLNPNQAAFLLNCFQRPNLSAFLLNCHPFPSQIFLTLRMRS